MENESLATELLHTLKRTIHILTAIIFTELAVILVLIWLMLFVPVEEGEISQEAYDVDSSTITQQIGDDYGDSETDI